MGTAGGVEACVLHTLRFSPGRLSSPRTCAPADVGSPQEGPQMRGVTRGGDPHAQPTPSGGAPTPTPPRACTGPGNYVHALNLARLATRPRACLGCSLRLSSGCRGRGQGRGVASGAGREIWGRARMGRRPRAWRDNLFLRLGPGSPRGGRAEQLHTGARRQGRLLRDQRGRSC